MSLWVVVTQSAEFGVDTSIVHGPYRSRERAERERLALHQAVNAVTVSDDHRGDFPVATVVKCSPGAIDVPMYQREWTDTEGVAA